MGLRAAYKEISQGIRVPYLPVGDRGRTGAGFIDLRGRPAEVDRVPEARSSVALRRVLVRLAAPDSPWFSVGCDLGGHEEPGMPLSRRHVAGGYLHVVGAAYGGLGMDRYVALAKALQAALEAKVANRFWDVAFLLQPIELTLDRDDAVRCPSLSLTFYASARHGGAARRSREALLKVVGDALLDPG